MTHNPWAYFADQTDRRNCQSFDLPAGTATGGELHDDAQAGTLPTVGMLIPNLSHGAQLFPRGRRCLVAAMDAHPDAGPRLPGRNLAIVITFDEDDNSGDNTVLTTVIAPTVHHVSAATSLDQLLGSSPDGWF